MPGRCLFFLNVSKGFAFNLSFLFFFSFLLPSLLVCLLFCLVFFPCEWLFWGIVTVFYARGSTSGTTGTALASVAGGSAPRQGAMEGETKRHGGFWVEVLVLGLDLVWVWFWVLVGVWFGVLVWGLLGWGLDRKISAGKRKMTKREVTNKEHSLRNSF